MAREWQRWIDQPYTAAALLLLGLAGALLRPAQWQLVLLGAAVLCAARSRGVRGGAAGSVAAGLVLLVWLTRHGSMWTVGDYTAYMGYFWAWVALVVLGISAGSLIQKRREAEETMAELRTAQQRLAALHTVALSLSSTLDVNRLITNLLDQLQSHWGYEYGAILLVDDEKQELVVAETRNYLAEPGERIPVARGICGAVVREGRPLRLDDVTRDPRYVPGLDGCRSELAVPLIFDGKTIGVLNVESRSPAAFGPADETLLTTVAEHAAAALGNARLHQQARQMALTDPHTGLSNYRHFQEQVQARVREAQLTGTPFSMLMLDIDHFKRINDTYGHPTGDAVLEQVARLLHASCRQGDLCFRYGGEEFAVTLPGAPREVAFRVAERIREKVASHSFVTLSGRRLDARVTVSIGLSTYPIDGMSPVDLVLVADKALYAAKAGGRNRVVGGPQSQAELARA